MAASPTYSSSVAAVRAQLLPADTTAWKDVYDNSAGTSPVRIEGLGIWLEYDGTVMGPNGSVALSHRYGMSEIHIYRIIARQRGLHRHETQQALML